MTCDNQQCGILTSEDSEQSEQPPFKLRNFKCCSDNHRIFKRLAMALTRLCVCTDWSEHLLVAHTTLLEMSCHGSLISLDRIIYMASKVKHQLYFCWNNVSNYLEEILFIMDFFLCETLHWYLNENNKKKYMRYSDFVGIMSFRDLSKLLAITLKSSRREP